MSNSDLDNCDGMVDNSAPSSPPVDQVSSAQTVVIVITDWDRGMSLTFPADEEVSKLLSRDEHIDLLTATLELARDADPEMDFEPTRRWVRQRASELTGPLAKAKSEIEQLELLAHHLAEVHGLKGDSDSFREAACSYLPHVIETGRGLPISLSVLYIAVAAEAQIPLTGVAAPAHFLTRFESAGGPLFLDAFSGGQIYDEADCVAFLYERTKLSPADIALSLGPIGPRVIIMRMLNNLRVLFAGQHLWNDLLPVQRRLAALQPANVQEQLDLAQVERRVGRLDDCIDRLRRLKASTSADWRPQIEAELSAARKVIALSN